MTPWPYRLLYILYYTNSMCVRQPRGQVKSLPVQFFKVTKEGQKWKNPLKSNIENADEREDVFYEKMKTFTGNVPA